MKTLLIKLMELHVLSLLLVSIVIYKTLILLGEILILFANVLIGLHSVVPSMV